MTTTNFYHNCLSEELQQQVSSQLKLLIPEQFSLNEEVAIHKARCADLVREWSTAREHYKASKALYEKLQTKDAQQLLIEARKRLDFTADKMAESYKLHKDIVLTAAAAESKAREALTERTLMLLMNAVLDLVHEYFDKGDAGSKHLMKQFEDELRGRVVIQEQDNEALAVEAEFYDMLGTVPTGPEESLNLEYGT